MMEEIIKKAREWALKEIKKTGYPSLFNFETSIKQGQRLSKLYKANKDIVMLGTILMDIKLGECLLSGKLSEHTKRGVEETKNFLKKFKIEKEEFKIIINCVEAHHKKVQYKSIEAEICANADCYRFLNPKNVFLSLSDNIKEFGLDGALKHVEQKMDEKYKILSLDICKKELEQCYRQFKDLIDKARGI